MQAAALQGVRRPPPVCAGLARCRPHERQGARDRWATRAKEVRAPRQRRRPQARGQKVFVQGDRGERPARPHRRAARTGRTKRGARGNCRVRGPSKLAAGSTEEQIDKFHRAYKLKHKDVDTGDVDVGSSKWAEDFLAALVAGAGKHAEWRKGTVDRNLQEVSKWVTARQACEEKQKGWTRQGRKKEWKHEDGRSTGRSGSGFIAYARTASGSATGARKDLGNRNPNIRKKRRNAFSKASVGADRPTLMRAKAPRAGQEK